MRNTGYSPEIASNADTGARCETGRCWRPLVATWHHAWRMGARSCGGISVRITGWHLPRLINAFPPATRRFCTHSERSPSMETRYRCPWYVATTRTIDRS